MRSRRRRKIRAVRTSGSPTRPCSLWPAGMERQQEAMNLLNDLVKDLKAHGANTVIGPLNWDEKGDLKGFEFGVFKWHADGSSSAAK